MSNDCVLRPSVDGLELNESISSRAGRDMSLTEMFPLPGGHPVEGVGVVVVVPVVVVVVPDDFTAAVASLWALADPSRLLAITLTRIVLPSSPDRTVNVLPVAPPMLLQASPLAPQINHWYWKLIGLDPFQVPGSAVSLLPTAALPSIVGNVSFDGTTASRVVAPIATPTTRRAARTAMTTGARRPENRAWLRTIFLTKSLL